jgi:amino-acid N-acetyltransferase
MTSAQLLQPNITMTKPARAKSATLPAPVRMRPGEAKDVSEIAALINHYASLGQMLPRKEDAILQNIHEFIVSESHDKVVACGALHRWDDESAEVRSLAVGEQYAGQGLGKQIVNRLLEMGKERRFEYAFALTLQVRFFEKLDFTVVRKSVLPQKIWGDCIICPFLYDCRETAVLKSLVVT